MKKTCISTNAKFTDFQVKKLTEAARDGNSLMAGLQTSTRGKDTR